MAKNRKGDGDLINFVAAAAHNGGDGLAIGQIFGVVQQTVAIGGDAVLDRTGIYTLPVDASTPAQGDALYWTGTALTTTALGNVWAGYANGAKVGSLVDCILAGKDIDGA